VREVQLRLKLQVTVRHLNVFLLISTTRLIVCFTKTKNI